MQVVPKYLCYKRGGCVDVRVRLLFLNYKLGRKSPCAI